MAAMVCESPKASAAMVCESPKATTAAAMGCESPKAAPQSSPARLGGGGVPCTVCGKTVYCGEAVSYNSQVYHGKCLKCSDCNAQCTVNSCAKFEEKIYCKRCFEKNGFARKQAQVKHWAQKSGGSGTFSGLGGGGMPCVACGKTSYAGESVSYDQHVYHVKCLKCTECSVQCTVNTCAKFEEKVYCKRCFQKNDFARKQTHVDWVPKRGSSVSGSGVQSALGGGGTPCVACGKTAYAGESVSYDQQIYHVKCLKCSECSVQSTVNTCAKFENQVYCKRCFQKNDFARKQTHVEWVAKTGGSSRGVHSSLGGGGTPCVACGKTAYAGESISYDQQIYHAKCLKCAECSLQCTVNTCAKFEEKVYCKRCFQKNNFARKQAQVEWVPKRGGSVGGGALGALGGGGMPCVVCGKTAYAGESVSYDQQVYHAKCLKCSECSVQCTVNSCAKFEENIYCKRCFEKNNFARKQAQVKHWSPKSGSGGFAFSGLGGGGTPCIACGKTAYAGESVSYDQQVYHAKCLKCTECSVECTVNTCAKFENKIYCKRCFQKNNFARKQAEVKFEAKERKKASTYRFNTLGGGGEKCISCGKTVYSAEMVLFEEKKYHVKCFKCEHCKVELKVNSAEHKGPTPYCKKCYYDLGLQKATINPFKARADSYGTI